MPDQHWENLQEIFHAAVALAPNERAVYLERSCSGNDSLRQAVESLIKSHEETGNFVDTPAYQAAADLFGQDVAEVYAGLGDKDQAFAWLEKDFQAHSGLLPRIRWYIPFESLRSDPRYADLLQRMGLPQ